LGGMGGSELKKTTRKEEINRKNTEATEGGEWGRRLFRGKRKGNVCEINMGWVEGNGG